MQEEDTTRVEAFSDGVFGIAMTLLILEIKVPHLPHEAPADKWWLFGALLSLWPSFIAFVLSFGTVLIMWVNHHGLFKHAHRTDNRLLFANGLLLLLVTFVPFPTAVLAEHLNKPSANAAATFYCATYVVIALCHNLLLPFLPIARPAPLDRRPTRRPRRGSGEPTALASPCIWRRRLPRSSARSADLQSVSRSGAFGSCSIIRRMSARVDPTSSPPLL